MIKNDKSNNGNHLDLSSRIEIERMLGENRSVTVIAKALDKSQTTVSREIKKRRVFAGRKDPETNRCAKKRNCLVKGLCEGHCTLKCSSCKTGKCNSLCDEFINDACERIVKAPYVCNGCKKVTGCKLDRYKYSAERAEKGYKAELSESRQGISLSEAEMAELDKIITPGIRNGQSVAHIILSNIGKIPVGEATLYRYLEEGYFSVTGFDMRRKLHYKPRTKRKETKEQDLKAYEGRRFSDFTEFMANHDVPFVQMDTLHGAKGTSKCLLTFYLMNGAVLLAFLLDACTQEEVKRVFDMIEFRIGPKAFHDTFPVILTDRGSEFKRPELLETSIKGGRRCHLFYCDPNAPFKSLRSKRYILS